MNSSSGGSVVQDADNDDVPLPSTELISVSEVPSLLGQIRPQGQAKNLIRRVKILLRTDPSSACQRLFNAAIHDLREKIVIAGVDVAKETADTYKLPPVTRAEDLEEYPTAKVIDLAHRMGLLSRAEWRRLSRCYEIRRDLEHEDDQYEAGVEDIIYIFKTGIEVILSRDPIQPLRIKDVKELVDRPDPLVPDEALLGDYDRAPGPRQEEICRFLISIALDEKRPEITQQNAFNLLTRFASHTKNQVTLNLVDFLQQRIGRRGLDRRHARVAVGAGIMPYLKRADRAAFFGQVLAQMEKVGTRWVAHAEHGELLRSFIEVGGLSIALKRSEEKF
jgi:hypothetical protein